MDPALLQAVLNVEAGGRTHDADTGLAVARFEVHVFRDTSGLDPATFDQHFRVKSWREAEFKDPAHRRVAQRPCEPGERASCHRPGRQPDQP